MSKAIPIAAQAAMAKFEAARAHLLAFEQQNEDVVKTYTMLRQAHNDALSHVKAVYKEHHEIIGSRFGDFEIRTSTEIDVEMLMQLLGPKSDPLVNVVYSLDRKTYNAAVKGGHIDSSIVAQVESRKRIAVYGPKEA